MGRKTTVWICQSTNLLNLSEEDLDIVVKGKPYERI